jgi:uncharacterized protein YgbK (DUF1537 family)
VLGDDGSAILYTALGPGDALPTAKRVGTSDVDRVGRALGRLLDPLAREFSVQRIVVAGGDTSSHALGELDIAALTLRLAIRSCMTRF